MGERLLRWMSWLSARPDVLFSTIFAGLWVFGTLALHYIPRPSISDPTQDVTLHWGDALGIAFFVAIIGTSLAYFFDYRRTK